MPRPAGHLNQEAVGNQLAASSAHSGRDSRLTAGPSADQTADSAANAVATDAADAADAQAARRVDRTVGGRWSFRLQKRAKLKSLLLFRLIYLIMTRKTGTQSTGTLRPHTWLTIKYFERKKKSSLSLWQRRSSNGKKLLLLLLGDYQRVIKSRRASVS